MKTNIKKSKKNDKAEKLLKNYRGTNGQVDWASFGNDLVLALEAARGIEVEADEKV